MKVNYKSDFELTIQLTAGGVDIAAPSWDWQLRFYTFDRQAVYTVAHIDGKAERCAVNTDGTITAYFDKHGLMPGVLRCEFVNLVPDSHYTHDTQMQVDPVELGVELWRGASDGGMDAVTLELAGQVLAEVQALAADLQQKAESGYFDGEPGPQGPQGPPGPAGPGLLVVTVTGSDQEALTADHTAAEILAAHDAGRPVVAVYDGEVYQLASVGASLASFSLASADLEVLAQIDVDGDGHAVRIFDEVQGVLTAGDGINIDGNVISATGGGGTGIESIEQTVTSDESGGINVVTITMSDGSTADFEIMNGKKGDKGDKGDTGPQGPKGDKGDKGDNGVHLGDVALVNNLIEGGEGNALSAEMGKVLAESCGVERDELTKTLAYDAFPAKGDYPIMVAGKTYSIHIKADKPMGQTQWELWARTASSTTRIQKFGSTDMSVEQVITYTPAADIYAIGCNYKSGVQDTTAMITYIIEYDTYHSELGRHLEALDEVLQYGNALILDVSNIQKIGTSAPYWIYKQRAPIMFAGGTYKITVTAEAVLSSSQKWELWGADYDLTSSTRVKLFVIQGVDMSIGASLIVTPTQDIYSLYCGYQSAGLGSTITMAYKVEQDKESQRLHDIEDDVRACEDAISSAGINRFDSYFRLGATENDTINLITRPIGLIVMGQSNADGRIPNADFPATATIDTPNDLTLSKQIEHCLFMKGDQESTYDEASKNFASRNNSGNWAFDDIVYNAVNQALGGNTDFYVIKQTRGATGIRLANGSFNANVNDFVKNGYAISQLYHFKLLIERALELNPDIDFKAILWHQGEAEWQVTEEGLYYECLCQVIYWLRGRVGNPKLPFIFGTVPTDSEQYSAVVKADMEKVAQDINDCYLVDLGAAGDMIDQFHFGASTAERLAREMYKIMRQNYMLAPMISPVSE